MKTRRIHILRVSTILLVMAVVGTLFVAFNAGERFYRHFYGVRPGVTLEGVLVEKQLEAEIRQRVERLAAVLDMAPQNARYDRKNAVIVAEKDGRKVDVNATVEAVMTAPPQTPVQLTLIKLEPEITAALYRTIDTKIASFSTSGGGSPGRTDNLYVAARYMNGLILAPGDVFSFNQATGPRTFERGYSMAPVVGGMGIGGGVCQVATTIYNTALQAGLEIIERYPHSVQVGYVPPGRDATVTDYIDMKFRNSSDKYIQIRSGAGGGHVWVQLWSQ
jgi:vancomycin resistance protein YoaR